jgi:hypothetical protein
MNPNFIPKKFIRLAKVKPYSVKHSIEHKIKENQEISEKIKKIPFYHCFFSPVHTFTRIDMETTMNYVLTEQEELHNFFSFFSQFQEKHFHILISDSFGVLEEALAFLNEHSLSRITGWKIGFNHQNQPLLFDFERNEENSSLMPIEWQVVDFLEKSPNLDSLSKENIHHIFQTFCKGHFSRKFEIQTPRKPEGEKIIFMEFMIPWINQPQERILDHIYKYDQRWNKYKLCVLYLDVISKYKQIDSPQLSLLIQRLWRDCRVLPGKCNE